MSSYSPKRSHPRARVESDSLRHLGFGWSWARVGARDAPCQCTRDAHATHVPMRRTYQTFTLFATGIVSPRVALFRKPDPTNCTVLMPPSPPPASKPDPTNCTVLMPPSPPPASKPDPTNCTVLMPPSPPPASKPDPTNCTVLMPPSPPPATDEFDSLHVGLVITLGVLAVVLLLTVSIVVHLIRMVRPPPPPRARTHPPDAAALRGLASTPRPSAPPQLPPTLTRAPPLPQEKKGSPLFIMPLMKERDVEAVAYPAKGADANTI